MSGVLLWVCLFVCIYVCACGVCECVSTLGMCMYVYREMHVGKCPCTLCPPVAFYVHMNACVVYKSLLLPASVVWFLCTSWSHNGIWSSLILPITPNGLYWSHEHISLYNTTQVVVLIAVMPHLLHRRRYHCQPPLLHTLWSHNGIWSTAYNSKWVCTEAMSIFHYTIPLKYWLWNTVKQTHTLPTIVY